MIPSAGFVLFWLWFLACVDSEKTRSVVRAQHCNEYLEKRLSKVKAQETPKFALNEIKVVP